MILIDFSGISIAPVAMGLANADENLIRHMILNSIRMYRQKFKDKYGEVVIVADAGGNWRKDVYPEYKAKRKDARAKSKVDWDEAFRCINLVRDELKEHFPYKVIHQWGCEADDAIAEIVKHTQEFGNHEEVMIVSADKDFRQLQKYGNVRQWSTATKKFLDEPNPRLYLEEHIIKGDTGDGVPNVLSDD
jgi:5'-3' exonuclease